MTIKVKHSNIEYVPLIEKYVSGGVLKFKFTWFIV